MYAIVKTGGKQYRVEQGQSLLVERLSAAAEGDTVTLDPLLCVDGEKLVDGADIAKVKVSARVVAHERGPKLRVVKFKPKRGYKRRTGHRQDLTRLEVTEIKVAARRAAAAKPKAAADDAAEATEAKPKAAAEAKPEAAPAKPKAPARTRRAPKKEDSDGS
jgi:large subunit ribosomal protein L21